MATLPAELELPSADAVEAQLYRVDLHEFLVAAWELVQPGRAFRDNWHIGAMAEHLEAVTEGEILKLVINVPPRFMKSLTTSVFWPAWEWLRDPGVQWLYLSHSSPLALRDAVRTRRLMASEGIRVGHIDPDMSLIRRVGYRGLLRLLGNEWKFTGDENVKSRYSNDHNGYRISTSIGGGATGEGGDRVVMDDPHKLEEAESEAKREEAVDFVNEVLPSRLNSEDARTVVIMQRVHELDVTGALLEQDGWTHLVLPMEYEPNHKLAWPGDPREETGELLWPQRFPVKRVRSLKQSLGSYKYAGQYQQRPAPAEGGVLKRGWWKFYEPHRPPPPKRVEASWDMTFKDTDGTDFVVGQLWLADLADRYLLAMIRARLSFTDTLDAVRVLSDYAVAQGWAKATHAKSVEDKANGSAVISSLKRKVSGLVAVEPEGGKLARAHAVAPQVEAGNVYLPRGVIPAPADPATDEAARAAWVALERDVPDEWAQIDTPRWEPIATEAFIDECATFPHGAFDDMVDSLTQGLNRMAGKAAAPREVKSGTYNRNRVR